MAFFARGGGGQEGLLCEGEGRDPPSKAAKVRAGGPYFGRQGALCPLPTGKQRRRVRAERRGRPIVC